MTRELEGENRIEKFRMVSEELVSKISAHEGVAGIVSIGGLVRGFTDKFSDLDIIVFLSDRDEHLRRQVHDIGLDEEKLSGIEIDLEVHLLEDFKRGKWNEVDKWEFGNSRIIFDPDGKIKKVFREKLRIPKDFWTKRIAVCSEYLRWYCCPSGEDVGTVAESWIERGDPVAAHYCLNYAVDLLARIVFALNKEFLPAPKWRIFYFHNLQWLPKDYEKSIRKAMTIKSFSAKDLHRRIEAVQEIWQRILPKIQDETGLTPELISKYYAQKILHQA